MADAAASAALASKQAKDSELVALKQQVDRLRSDITPGKGMQQKLRKACTDFEAVFISKMWEQMRATVPKEGYLHSPQEDMYRSMFDRDFAEKMANDGGIGLGDMMYSQLKDKLANTMKSTKTDGAAAAEGAAAAGGTGQQAVKPLRPLHGGSQSSLDKGAEIKPLPDKSQGIALDRKKLVSTKTYPASAAPQRPASVAGEVMAEVEALARRIEEDFARRNLSGAYGKAGEESGSSGRKLAVIG